MTERVEWLGPGQPNNLEHAVVGRVITSIEGMEKDSYTVVLHFIDGGRLTLDHSQDCCESVDLQDFYGEEERGTILSFEERADSADGSEEVSESGTWTFYSIQTTTGEIWMRWLGQSNGYYSEAVDTNLTNTDRVLVIEDAVPKLYVRDGEDHDAPHYLAAKGQPGMTNEQMQQWINMAAEITKS